MEPTNIKVGEYVGVYHDSKDGSFHFDTISAEEYDTAKQDSSSDLVAAFIISPNGFMTTSGGYVDDVKTYLPPEDTIFYVSGIVILSECNGIIYDVLSDFMAINALERGGEFVSVKVEVDLKASRLNTKLARYLTNDEDSNYDLVYSNNKCAYYEAQFSNSFTNISIEETLRIALEAHTGQKDLDGNPAILHPLAVGLMGKTEAEVKTGFLHDVVEDSSITLEDLKNRGVEDEVLTALALLSHDKEKVGYFEYVENIIASGNVTAIHVKLNDLHHNLQRGKESYEEAVASNDTAKLKELDRINTKHTKALEMIIKAGYENCN